MHMAAAAEVDKKHFANEPAALAQIVQGSTIPTFVIDGDHIVTHWNRALEILSELSAAEIVGTDRHWAIFRSGKRPTLADLIVDEVEIDTVKKTYGARGRPSPLIDGAYETEAFYPNLGENGKWLFCTAAPIKASDERTIGAIETLWDKTDEKRRAEEAKRQAEFQHMLITASTCAIVATDKNGKVAIFNPAAEVIFGYAAREVTARIDAGDLFPVEVNASFERQVQSGRWEKVIPWFEVMISTRNGLRVPVNFSGKLLVENGKVIGRVAFFQDLREIKQLQRELITAARLSAVGQTVAGLAHYIKNILAGLSGGSYVVDVALEDNDPNRLKAGWSSVKRNIARISDLVQDLLTYSKDREAEYAPCKPNDIVDDLFDLFQDRVRRSGIEIVKQCDASIGEVELDPSILHRCLLNLVTNAVDACEMDKDPQKRHRIRIQTTLENDGRIRFDVADNGSGMSRETQTKLFTALFSTKGGKGTGIGLLVTRKLVQEHGGQIDFVSRPGEGTTFTLRLPCRSIGGG
jgi:PAS domain S-box-containing protein